MIILVHMIFGAAIGSIVKTPILAVFLAFLGHYFLDLFPHIEYNIANIRNKNWRKSLSDILKVILDFLCGAATIFIFSKNQPIIYLGAFVALIPDTLTLISSVFPNKILAMHDKIHTQKIHFLRHKKIPNFWRITTQVLAVIISIFLLKYL